MKHGWLRNISIALLSYKIQMCEITSFSRSIWLTFWTWTTWDPNKKRGRTMRLVKYRKERDHWSSTNDVLWNCRTTVCKGRGDTTTDTANNEHIQQFKLLSHPNQSALCTVVLNKRIYILWSIEKYINPPTECVTNDPKLIPTMQCHAGPYTPSNSCKIQ